MPKTVKPYDDLETVEDFFNDLNAFLDTRQAAPICLYILDSLDALSDAAEMERGIGEGSFGAQKAKKMSEMFRRLVKRIDKANCILIIISQLRDAINVMWGEKQKRSGGRALDYYASQVLWLREKQKIKRTVFGAERVVGVHVSAITKKNKLTCAFREVDLIIIMNYGADNEESILQWLAQNPKASKIKVNIEETRKQIAAARKQRDKGALTKINDRLRAAVVDGWFNIEKAVEPTLRKYE